MRRSPSPRADEALVRSVVAGVCGSDTHAAHGRHPFIPIPYHPGHEVVGVAEQVGPGVTGVAAGRQWPLNPFVRCRLAALGPHTPGSDSAAATSSSKPALMPVLSTPMSGTASKSALIPKFSWSR